MRRAVLPALVLLTVPFSRADVINSRHNLSVSGPGEITATTETRVCIFCHTSHGAEAATPLWNHQLSPPGGYATYSSSTLSVPGPLGQPTGSSKLCLSCHDGTVALGQTISDGLLEVRNTDPGGRLPAGHSNLGTDLTDDHPVSFRPNPTNRAVMNPPSGDPVRLDHQGLIQCTSCHDPHEEDRDPVTRKFLVKSNRGSAICLTCHRPVGWVGNSHQSASLPYTAEQGAHTGYTTVEDNGCESCHRPHSAGVAQRILKFPEEKTCVACHDGSVASDVATDLLKPYSHPSMSMGVSSHEPEESPENPSATLPELSPGARRHVTCSDCHNPHASSPATVPAQDLPGALTGSWGIDGSGVPQNPARSEHQVCYKCHGDSANKPQAAGLPNPPYVRRQIVQFNTSREFDPLNPSHHAVESPGTNPDVPSLIPPWTTSSTLRCLDCHGSDSSPSAGGRGARGPHGSIYNHLLERNLNAGDRNSGGDYSQMYALCFKCHSESSILSDESFAGHRLHIERENASCMVCHDPHGISQRQGNRYNNSHLINFDVSIVTPTQEGLLMFEDRGVFRGACYLRCHGAEHSPTEY